MAHNNSTSTILDYPQIPEKPFQQTDKYSITENPEALVSFTVEPGQIALEKYAEMPDRYLPIQHKDALGGLADLGYNFAPEVSKYFMSLPEGSIETDLYIALGNFVEVKAGNSEAKEYAQERLDVIREIGEYFLTYSANSEDSLNKSLPEEVKALRRTAISIYKAARLNQIVMNSGANKVSIKPATKAELPLDDLELYDTLIEKVIPPTPIWNGRIPRISEAALMRIRERELTEKPTRARISNLENWDPEEKFSPKYLKLVGYYARTDTYTDIKHIEELSQKLDNPRILPEIYSKNAQKESKAFFVEHIPNPLYGDDLEANTERTLQVAKALGDIAKNGGFLMDIKPTNFRTRKDGSIAVIDLGSIIKTGNSRVAKPSQLENAELNYVYAAPEIYIAQKLIQEEQTSIAPEIDTSKAQAFALGSMLFRAQLGKKVDKDLEAPVTTVAYDTETKAFLVLEEDETNILGESTVQVEAENISRQMVLDLYYSDAKFRSNPYIRLILDSLEPDPKARISRETFIAELETLIKEQNEVPEDY